MAQARRKEMAAVFEEACADRTEAAVADGAASGNDDQASGSGGGRRMGRRGAGATGRASEARTAAEREDAQGLLGFGRGGTLPVGFGRPASAEAGHRAGGREAEPAQAAAPAAEGKKKSTRKKKIKKKAKGSTERASAAT